MELIVALIIVGVLGLGCLAMGVLCLCLRRRPDQDLARDMVSVALGAFESGFQRKAGVDEPVPGYMADTRRSINMIETDRVPRGIVDPDEVDAPIQPGELPHGN